MSGGGGAPKGAATRLVQLFVLVGVALTWMHFAVRQMERSAQRRGEAALVPELPEMQGFGEPGIEAPPRRAGPIADWRPEDEDFWKSRGKAILSLIKAA